MNERRQRVSLAAGAALVTLTLLVGGSACEVRSSVEGAQTAVAVAQTALPGVQTALPGLQATAQVGATLVSGVLGDPQAVSLQLQALLAGATVDISTDPPEGSARETITHVSISASDAHGSFVQLDPRGRQAAAGAALLLVGQYYPAADVSLSVTDATGAPLASGTRAPGQVPAVVVGQ